MGVISAHVCTHKTRNIHPPSIQDLDPCSLAQRIRKSPSPPRFPCKKGRWNTVTHVVGVYLPAATFDLVGQREWQYDRWDVNYKLEVRVQLRHGCRAMATILEEEILA